MPILFSPVIASRVHRIGETFAARSLDLSQAAEAVSPILVVDDFRVRGRVFGPHPHAGFSAVTYVFEDSRVGLRSRDSLGNDVIVRPGGIVWTQAARGAMHEEVPAEPGRELHGLQVFVNLSAHNKLAAPQVLWLENSEVPEWRGEQGDRVRVAVGSFEHLSSPLVPAEPFDLLDVELRSEIAFTLRPGRNALIYLVEGETLITADGMQQTLLGKHAVAISGTDTRVTLQAKTPAHLLYLSGTDLREPVYSHGPFVMNDRSQTDDAMARYRAGAMGHLTPLSKQ